MANRFQCFSELRIVLRMLCLFTYFLAGHFGFAAEPNQDVGLPAIWSFGPKTQVWCALQDKRGLMYFGTNLGIVELDGVNDTIIKVPDQTIIRSLAMDPNGIIYYGGRGDFGYLTASSDGNFKIVSLREKVPADIWNFTDGWQIFINSKGVYFGTSAKIFRYPNGLIQLIEAHSTRQKGVAFGDSFFYVDHERGLCYIDGENVQQLPQKKYNEKYSQDIVFNLFKENKLLVNWTKNIWEIYDLNPFKNSQSGRGWFSRFLF